ncbi:winged helix-turn-helix transcriptional regulator [Streptomyces sp. SBST2-5]|uniref:Winged helix-turn-helix transcriptional regulator n=1 Tax=Streptomyces composti TaxID=2720025 RepID=A0ABX1A5Z1_9ACTN|nr:MarR family winged helix-turn-helix transcriptional regulator [Streptomyces composti]NJP51875.1 winged helix-turn-helix transcriptional regulator [Streptomyces composti]
MQYSHSDAELIKQPIGYWAWAAHKAVVTRTRTALAELDLTQPQWWILAQTARTGGRTRDELLDMLSGYLDTGREGITAEIDACVAHTLLDEDGEGRLTPTDQGRARYEKAAALQDELWAERHAGISDEEYLTTMKVLQRFIHNTGGRAWHH